MDLQQAKLFLSLVVPWADDGRFFTNLHYKNRDRQGLPGKPFTSVKDMVSHIEWRMLRDMTGADFYVCMSGQSQRTMSGLTPQGKQKWKAERKKENVVALKAFWVDIDIGKEDGYQSFGEAAKGLVDFCAAIDLPRPNVTVNSGYGLHAYWALAEAVPFSVWNPLTHALVAAIRAHGLKCDTQVTVDAARVLRVPGTVNMKRGGKGVPVTLVHPPRDVFMLERIERALAPFVGKGLVLPQQVTSFDGLTLRPIPSLGPVENELGSGLERESVPISPHVIAKVCPFIDDAMQTGGRDHDQPLWNMTMLAAVFMDGGRTAAHVMSQSHPGYDPDNVDAMYDRKEREKDGGLGWPSCQAFSNAGAKQCAGCQHAQKGKSPLFWALTSQNSAITAAHVTATLLSGNSSNTGATSPGGVSTNPSAQSSASSTSQALLSSSPPASLSPGAMPSGYTQLIDLCVYQIVVDDQGNQQNVRLCDRPFYDPQLGHDRLLVTTRTDAGRTKEITILFEWLADQFTFRKQLSGIGVVEQVRTYQALQEFIVAWVKDLQQRMTAVRANPFGWVTSAGKVEGFAYGGRLWTPTGDRVAIVSDEVMHEQYSPMGDIGPWRDAAQMLIDGHRQDINTLLVSAFAAPLVKFTGHSGFILAGWSTESGIGKTTAIKVAQSVWGNPQTGIQQMDDTNNAVFKKIAELQSLPLYWDEIKGDENTRKFTDLVFGVTLGKGKSRLNQSADFKEVGKWQTMLISCTNESLVDHVVRKTKTTTAGLHRLFEFRIEPSKTKSAITTAEAQIRLGELNDNYGAVGLAYAQFLGQNAEQIRKDVETVSREIEIELGGSSDERFWRSTICTLLLGAKYASDLGFMKIDQDDLKAFLVTCLGKLRQMVIDQPINMRDTFNVVSVLAEYLDYGRSRHTLKTDRVHIGRGRPSTGATTVVGDITKIDALWVHMGVQDKLIRMSTTAFHDWLRHREYNATMVVTAMTEQLGMRRTKGRLGGGTPLSTVDMYIYEFDANDQRLAAFCEL